MIPINTQYTTPLSFEKISKLLQVLVDKKDTLNLSDEIEQAMDTVMEVQREFVEKIDITTYID